MNRWLSLGLIISLGFLLGMLGFSLWGKPPASLEKVSWSAETQWIGPQDPGYRFYVRYTFDLPDTVEAGWLRLSADNDYTLYVNGQLIAEETSLSNNTVGLGRELTEPHQGFNDSFPYRVGADPILITPAQDWKVSVYSDLTPYLHPGKNAIALEVQKSRKTPRLAVEGAIYPVSRDSKIDLTTGVSNWRVSSFSESHQGSEWFALDFPDENWAEAKTISPVRESTYSRLSYHLFDRFLQGNWITGAESSKGELWLTGHWQIPQPRHRSFVRFAGDGEYALLINGLFVKRYVPAASNQLHMYEVTNLLRTGDNTLTVRLARPLNWQLTQSSPLRFFLDGWVETENGTMIAPIATDHSWSAQPRFLLDEVENPAPQAIAILEAPNPQGFHRTFEGDAYLLNYPNDLMHQSLWRLAGVGWVWILTWILGRCWMGDRQDGWRSVATGTGLLFPGFLFLVGIGLLKHRYAESELGLLWFNPQSNLWVSLGLVGILIITLLWVQIRSHQRQQSEHCDLGTTPGGWRWLLLGLLFSLELGLILKGTLPSVYMAMFLLFGLIAVALLVPLPHQTIASFQEGADLALTLYSRWGKWVLLTSIIAVGFGLRAYGLDLTGHFADENTSLDAIRGILRSGVPESTSEVWYTRSPGYHYMMALWLKLVGDSFVNARFLSVLWGTATLVLLFAFAKRVTGKIWIALVVTAIFAINPWVIIASRVIRFYQVVQFMSLLSVWMFVEGFIEHRGRIYQGIFFVALTFAMLNQEILITLVPCFLIGFLFFYRSFRWERDWILFVGGALTVGIVLYDVTFFSIKCLTPWVALSTTTDSISKLHLSYITQFVSSLFVGATRMNTIYSFFFLLGFLYFLKQKNGKIIFLFSVVIFNITILTLLLRVGASRYTYHLYPLFILLSVYSAIELMTDLGSYFERVSGELLPMRKIVLFALALLLVGNTQLGKILAGYNDAIVPKNEQIYQYIHAHRQPDDVVISTAPQVAPIELGKLDYFLRPQLSFDMLYLNQGRVIERWAGGQVISNLDQMSHVLATADRVWLHIGDRQLSREPEFADLTGYFQTLGQPVLETFGARLRLWQRTDGILPRIPNQGKDLGNY